jgi:hypothetical protein
VGSFWGRCGARSKGQGQDGSKKEAFCRALPTPQQPSPLPRSLIGSDIIFISRLCCGWLLGEGRGARGKGQGARGKGMRCFFFFASWGRVPTASYAMHLLPVLPRPLPCCRNPIRVNQPCLTLFVSKRLHFAASSQWVCAAPLGCCRESGVGVLGVFALCLPPGSGCVMVLLARVSSNPPITRALAPDVTSVGVCVLPHVQWV